MSQVHSHPEAGDQAHWRPPAVIPFPVGDAIEMLSKSILCYSIGLGDTNEYVGAFLTVSFLRDGESGKEPDTIHFEVWAEGVDHIPVESVEFPGR